ncbi:MAG TPA: hypothetical protein VHE35_34110 [Kofleriaceae bacterium]|nr:hypothetical protein [Kofleriaceae bacterium]
MARPRPPVHQLVHILGGALRGLGLAAAPLDVERWGFALHGALSAPGREYHNHDHVLELADGGRGEPLDVLAALYHDAIYLQVDQGPPPAMAAELARVLDHTDVGWQVRAPSTPAVADVLVVFGRAAGDWVTPAAGINELASALIAALHLGATLDRAALVTLAMAIEQTIPFRSEPVAPLVARGAALGFDPPAVEAMVRRAVRFANRDVDNFATPDPGRFLDSTWKLLPESNPTLQLPWVYTVRDYRIALEKMEGFLGSLPAERVFHRWDGEPSADVHAERVRQATANLDLAVRYLRIKLYSIAVVEALCDATGGDVPLDYFMGGPPGPAEAPLRVDGHLPAVARPADRDPVLDALLTAGRASPSSFDTGPSPLAAFLHATCSDAAIARGLATARELWAGRRTAHDFLRDQPTAVADIAAAAAEIVETRADALRGLAARLRTTE